MRILTLDAQLEPRRRGSLRSVHGACPIGDECDGFSFVGVTGVGAKGYRVLRCTTHSIEFVDSPPKFDVAATEAANDLLYRSGAASARTTRPGRFLDLVALFAKPPGVLHDHGCGAGQIMWEAARRGWTVQGNDLIAAPAELPRSGARYFRGELASLDLIESADVVTSYCVLPHVTDPLAELKAIHRTLRPNGWVVAEMPTSGIFRRTAHILHRASMFRWGWVLAQIYSPDGHRLGFDQKSARIALETSGFRSIDVRVFRHDRTHALARFSSRGGAVRTVAWVAVFILDALSRVPGGANHIVAVGQK